MTTTAKTADTMQTRRGIAAERLARLCDAAPEHRAQRLDDWLQVATRGERRRAPAWIRRMIPSYLLD